MNASTVYKRNQIMNTEFVRKITKQKGHNSLNQIGRNKMKRQIKRDEKDRQAEINARRKYKVD